MMESLPDTRPRHITLTTTLGPAVEVGDLRVQPVARSLGLRCGWGVFVHTRPSAVLVSKEEETSRVPIIDVTRWGQAAVVLAALLSTYGLLVRAKRRKERSP